MKTMTSSIWRSLVVTLCVLLTATGCSSAPKSLGVPLVGVNYTDFDYSMSVHDLSDPGNRVSSGELTPFSAGGQMCCFTLPPEWRPGAKVRVRSLKGISENGVWVRDDVTEQDVELPHYTRGELGTLWVLQFADGRVEVLNSSVGPEHPQWSGSVKGWPQPSLAYRTKIWKIHYDQTVSDVALYGRLIQRMKTDPQGTAKEMWEFSSRYSQSDVKNFVDHLDEAYWESLKSEFNQGLARTKKRLQELEERRPK